MDIDKKRKILRETTADLAREVLWDSKQRRREDWFDEDWEHVIAKKNGGRKRMLQRVIRTLNDEYRDKRIVSEEYAGEFKITPKTTVRSHGGKSNLREWGKVRDFY